MASEDVIELGSSDEETRPAKKMKAGPNAMVHIPNSLHGVTIKPRPSSAPANAGIKIPLLNKNIAKTNGKKPQTVTRKPVTIRNDLHTRIPVTGKVNRPLGVNPVTLMKKINSSQIMINKLPSNVNVLKAPIPVMKGPINLPSSITVKKTSNSKRPAASNLSGVKKKQKSNQTVREVLTIDSDDEETVKPQPAKPTGPQWYLRPEELDDLKNQEKKNNTEPETPKFIEITIEDSPVKPVKDKPVKNKRTCKVGTELAITIDDSPVKPKETSPSDKNKETGNTTHSKKKLEYPVETFEIEIEPMEVGESYLQSRDVQEPEKDPFSTLEETETNKEHNIDNKDIEVNIEKQNEIIEVAESPAKKKKDNQISKPKEAPSKVIDLDLEDESTSSEFHPVYQKFIDLCLKIEDSVDMKTIVEKKIKSYYRQVPKEYTESEEFIDLVSGKILSIKAGPEKIYLYIKDIVDELNMQRKLTKQQAVSETKKKNAEEDNFLYGEDTDFDSKRQRQIRKLEKTLKKLHRAIQKLEEQEVDFDDEEDSVYLLTERYKERMVRVHAKLCQLSNTKMPSEPRLQIDARPGQPSGPAKRLEKWVNKKVPIGTPLPFPDFHDVLRCVREANEDDKLGWNEADVMEEARDLFVRCGKKLQRRRQENEWRLAASRIPVDVDPALENEALKKKLEENRQLATKKETEVFNKYADRQSMLKLEAEVVGDKEAEESPVESEEEEPDDDSCTLQNKERRKERLRRLIQEKPRNSDKNSSQQKELDIENKSIETNKGVIDDINDASNVEKETEKLETDTKLQEESKYENKVELKKVEKVHSISDSSDNVGSDVDELHLLQKLHSGNEVDSSTSESSGSLIDISDTIQSDNENNEKVQSGDVISIENSSYSDSEHSNDARKSSVTTKATDSQADSVEKEPDVEQVLLTGSDEDQPSKDDESQGSDMACMNTQDDAISIGDTQVQGMENTTTTSNITESISKSKSPEPETSKMTSCSEQENNMNDDKLFEISPSSAVLRSQGSDMACMNTQDDAISIGDTQIQGMENTTTTSNITESISKSNSPEPETSIMTSCSEQENNMNDDKLFEISPSSAVLRSQGSDMACMNTQDDAISIGDTQVQGMENTTTPSNITEIISKSNSPEPETIKMTSCSEQKNKNIDDKLFEISPSSAVLNTDLGLENLDLPTVKQVNKVDDEQDVNKDSDKYRKKEESRESNESNLSLKEDEIVLNKVGSQDADLTHTAEVTKPKVDDEQVLIKESDNNRKNKKDENDSCESNLVLQEDEIILNEVASQDADLLHTILNSNDENCPTDRSCPETDKIIEQNCLENNTEPLSSKDADVNEETLKDEENEPVAKTAIKDADLSGDTNKISADFKQTDSLEHMLEEFRSDLEGNEC